MKITKACKLLALAAVLLPAITSAGDKAYKEGTLLEGPVKASDSSLGSGETKVITKNWVIVVKVGEYAYAGYIDRTGGIFASKGPKTEDWPLNSKVQVYFHHRMGSLYMDLKSPTGKEEDSTWVFSKKGPDGKELCGSFKCAKTPEDGDD
jgi:hypothetical protein